MPSRWNDWRLARDLRDVRSFVIVAYLHAGSYLGGLLGLVCAGVSVRRGLRGIRRDSPLPDPPPSKGEGTRSHGMRD
jgi:hypothetical protein